MTTENKRMAKLVTVYVAELDVAASCEDSENRTASLLVDFLLGAGESGLNELKRLGKCGHCHDCEAPIQDIGNLNERPEDGLEPYKDYATYCTQCSTWKCNTCFEEGGDPKIGAKDGNCARCTEKAMKDEERYHD